MAGSNVSTNGVKLRRNSSFTKLLRERGSPDVRRRSIPLMPATMPVDRESMLVMEANEISQYLKKHYRFSREKDDAIKVVNTMLGLSCLWTMERLRERLVSMRKLMYNADADKSAMAGESVFFDPSDTWTKEETDISFHILESPRIKKQEAPPAKTSATKQKPPPVEPSQPNSSRPPSRGAERSETPSSNSRPLVCEVYPTVKNKQKKDVTKDQQSDSSRSSADSFESSAVPKPIKSKSPVAFPSSSAASATRAPSSSITTAPRKPSPAVSEDDDPYRPPPAAKVNACVQTDRQLRSSPVVGLSLNMIKLLRDRLRSGDSEDKGLVDHMLGNCESLKVVVVHILEGFSQVQDSGDEIARFNDSDLMKTCSMQLVSALELLVSNIHHLSQCQDVCQTEAVSSIHEKMIATRNDLATELIILLHESQNCSPSGVEESSSRVLEMLYDMASHCGLYSMTLAEPCPASLRDAPESTIQDLVAMRNNDHDILNKFPDPDIKQSFVSGADKVIRGQLEEAKSTIHTCEKGLLVLAENSSKIIEEVIVQSHRVVGASRALLKLLLHIQTQINKRLLEDKQRAKHYYCFHYTRDLNIGAKVNTLVSGITMLSQATTSLVQEDQRNFRRVLRCVEIVQKATVSLVNVAKHDVPVEHSEIDVPRSNADISCVLQELEAKKLHDSCDDITKATTAMIGRVKQHVTEDDQSSFKSRRMLPAPPGGGHGVVRCNSAKSANDRKMLLPRQKSLRTLKNS